MSKALSNTREEPSHPFVTEGEFMSTNVPTNPVSSLANLETAFATVPAGSKY